MINFGGNKFDNCSVPLAFEGRYFIVEKINNCDLVSVVLEYKGDRLFEVFRNKPNENPLTEITVTTPGILTVVDKETNSFLYKIRPGSETSVIFGTIKGEELSARISDKMIQIGGITIQNNQFVGLQAGIVVDKNGGVGIGAPIPSILLPLFEKK